MRLYESPDDYYRAHGELRNHYGCPWHEDQPVNVSVLCEAAGMVPMLARAVKPYRIGVGSSSGFDSLTVKHDLWRDAARRYDESLQTMVLLHLGDHDPSGESVHESMAADFVAFSRDEGYPEDLLEVRRVALTPAQILELDIEAKPDAINDDDPRAPEFRARGLVPAQLEAVPPAQLTAILQGAVESTLDMDILAASQADEREERAEVQSKLDEVNEVLRDAFGLDDDDEED